MFILPSELVLLGRHVVERIRPEEHIIVVSYALVVQVAQYLSHTHVGHTDGRLACPRLHILLLDL